MVDASPKPRRLLMIIHVITRFERAGAEENTTLTINHQVWQGHHVMLICGAGADHEMLARLHDRVEVIELPELVHPIHPLKDFAALRSLRKLFQAHQPAIVHTHQSKAGILGRLAARWAKVPHIIHTTHILAFLNVKPFKHLMFWLLEKIAGWCTDAFVHVSPAMEDASKAAGLGRGKIHQVIYSGMDLARFRNASPPVDAAQLMPSHGAGHNRLIVLYLSAFEPRKRQMEMIPIFQAVLRQVPDALFLLAGTGSEEHMVQEFVDSQQLNDQIKLLGYRNDPEALIALSDICVFGSEREGLPRSVIQYVAGGRPVISTDLPGITTLIQPNVNGYLVPVDRLVDMVDPLVKLLRDETLRQEMGQQSAFKDLSAWEASHMVEAIDELIAKLMLAD